jgi:hypothetical protein
MPQLHLPMFPTGVTHITSELAFEKKDHCCPVDGGYDFSIALQDKGF